MFCNERPIFGLKCPFRSVSYPDGRVLGILCGKMAQNMFLEGHKYLRFFLGGWDASPLSWSTYILLNICYFGQN